MLNLYFFYRMFRQRNRFCAHSGGAFFDPACRLLLSGRIDNGNTRPQDPRLLSGDLPKRFPQIFRMIIANGRDHAHVFSLYGIGGIQPAPKAGLQHHIFHAFFLKKDHCHKEQEFKKAGMIGLLHKFRRQCGELFPYRCKSLQKLFLRSNHPVRHKPFPHRNQMG